MNTIKSLPVTEQCRQARYRQKSISLILNCEDPIETAVELEQQLFYRGHAAVIVLPEDARTTCPYIEAMGLIAIIAGSNGSIPFGIKINTSNINDILRSLNEKQLLLP